MTIGEARRFVMDEAPTSGDLTADSRDRFRAILLRFERFARASRRIEMVDEVDRDLVLAFLDALALTREAPAPKTKQVRLSAVRHLFRTLRRLGLTTNDPTADIVVGSPVDAEGPRPLTDDEVTRCREVAATAILADRYVSIWALAEAGASTSEISMVKVEDFDLDLGRVRIGPSPKGYPRTLALTPWGLKALVDRARSVGAGAWVPVAGNRGHHSARTSVSAALREIMARAGVADPLVEPRSIAAWAGREVLGRTGRIEVVARTLGFRSLDRTAELIRLDWLEGRPD